MKQILHIIAFSLIWANGFAQQEKWTLKSENSQILYKARHLLHPWEGVNTQVKAIAKINTEDQTFEELAVLTLVRDFDSKNTGRDAHALEVLEALSYPEVRFYANSFQMERDSIQIQGTLDFHGVSKPLSAKAYLLKEKKQWILTGKFKIQPTAFGVTLPSFMLVKMEDELLFEYRLIFQKP